MGGSSPSRSSASEPPLTISSLLGSLHNHLQIQTQLLPTLHAQLGLPASALTDELNALHQKLTACVEEQIDLRRQEVDKWMGKCETIERECKKYTKALGAHTKAVSASVGELRKQQVLPVRYEMLNQHLDKLDHLYKAKLEQLGNLTNRVVALTDTLGPDFFSLDLTEPPPAYGEMASDLPLREVTPERFSKLEKELARGKSEINRRLQQLSATFLQMDWLYSELDIPPPSDDADDEDLFSAPSTSSLKPPVSRVSSMSLKSNDLFMSSTSSVAVPTPCPRGKSRSGSLVEESESAPITAYFRIYRTFLARVEEAESRGKSLEDHPLLGLEGVQPSLELLAWASQSQSQLEEIKRRREAHIQAMYDQLEALWKRLGVEDEDIDGFVDNHRGSTEAVVSAYEEELERMLELKRERMGVFVGNARVEIEALWDELMYGDDERREFVPFWDDEHSEDLLTTHEEEITRLKEEKHVKAPILASIRKYFEICDGEKELAAAAADQSRLLGRGPRDPGRLLREEKMRKRVMREKPKLEQELLRSIPAWEEMEGRAFMVNGARMLDVLETLRATARVEKENNSNSRSASRMGMSTRSGSVPPRATTPQTQNQAPQTRSTSRNMNQIQTRSGSGMLAGTKRSASRCGVSSDSESVNGGGPAAKKARIVSATTGLSRAMARPVGGPPSSSNGKDATGRAPFGSRTVALNSGSDGPMSTRKGVGSCTPSITAASSVTKPAPPSTRGTGIGLGHPSSATRSRAGTQTRPASAAATTSSSSATKPAWGAGRTVTRSKAASVALPSPRRPGAGKLRSPAKSKPVARHRKESFRPRPSLVGAAGGGPPPSRFGGPFAFSLKEVEEEEG